MCNKVNTKMVKPTRTIAESFFPVVVYNAIMGTSVYESPFAEPWLKLSILYIICRSLGYGVLVWFAEKLPSPQLEALLTTVTVFRVISWINVGIAIVSTVLGIIQYKRKRSFYKKITLIDETMEVFGIDPQYTNTSRRNLRMVLFWVGVGFAIFSSDLAIAFAVFPNKFEALLKICAFEIPLVMNHMVDLTFSAAILTIGDRFERLNALIYSVITNPLQAANSLNSNRYQNILINCQKKVSVKPSYHLKNRNNIDLLLKVVRQLHLDLCATARSVNDTYSKQMSMQMAATFILLTGFSYCFYQIYNQISMPLTEKMRYYGSLASWIIVSIANMIYVVRISVNVATESQKTSQIAHEIHVTSSQSKLTDEIHQLSLQIMQHPLCFTASGLVTLDFGYVRGFVGSVTTYLMILIQNQPDMIKAANTLTDTSSDNDTIASLMKH